MEFPYTCCRCGFCCLHEMCPVGMAVFGECEWCPALSFNGDVAICDLAGFLVPVGEGCCIKARAFKDGKQYDFAAVSPKMKIGAAQDLLKRKGGMT